MKKEKKERTNKKSSVIILQYPYLFLLTATAAAAMVCSDEIGFRAIAEDARIMLRRDVEMESFADGPAAEMALEQVAEGGNTVRKSSETGDGETENAGKCRAENNAETSGNKLENENYNLKNMENTEETVIGETKFETYEPQQIDSPYYSDAGKIALTTDYPYVTENTSYFNDAAFIGDSRTLGISDYAGLDGADFYCDSGMTVLKLLDDSGITYQKDGTRVKLPEVLRQKTYGKIYIMLGMNDLGYGTTQDYLERYGGVVRQIREWQPDAVIYVMANLHVSREKNSPETEFNNININDKNAAAALLANGKDIFYLDANPLFTDEEGYLKEELTFDGVHLYAQHYDAWRQFLLEHAVEPERAHAADTTGTGATDTTGAGAADPTGTGGADPAGAEDAQAAG